MSGSLLSIWKGDIPTGRQLVAPIIIEQTAWEHNLTVADLRSPCRHRAVAYARFDAMTRLRAVITPDGRHRFSMPQIARLLGRKDHTTVLSGLRRWQAICDETHAKREAAAA